MSRTRRNPPGWTKQPEDTHSAIVFDTEKVVQNFERGHVPGEDIKDNPKRRDRKWKLINGICCHRTAKRYLKAKRNRAERRTSSL